MSPIIQFTAEDLLRGKIVEPAWYRVKIDNVGEAPSKDGGSTNYPVEGKIIRNSETGSEDFTGVPINWNFNSKMLSAMRGFLECMGVSVTEGARYELANCIGKEIEVFIENDTWNGRMLNRVNHKYRPLRSA